MSGEIKELNEQNYVTKLQIPVTLIHFNTTLKQWWDHFYKSIDIIISILNEDYLAITASNQVNTEGVLHC